MNATLAHATGTPSTASARPSSLAPAPFTPSGHLNVFGVRALLLRAASAGLVQLPSPQPARKPYPEVRKPSATPRRRHGVLRKDIMELAQGGLPFDCHSLECNRMTFNKNVHQLIGYGWVKIQKKAVHLGYKTVPTQYIVTPLGQGMNLETMQ